MQPGLICLFDGICDLGLAAFLVGDDQSSDSDIFCPKDG